MRRSSPTEQVLERGICPIDLATANQFIRDHHSYLAGARGCLFCVAAFNIARITAVAVISRPISPTQQDGVTAEIIRLCTHDAPPNTASALIRRSTQAAFAIGYHRVITYVDASKDGTAFRAAGFSKLHTRSRSQWHGRSLCIPDRGTASITLFEVKLASWQRAVTAFNHRSEVSRQS
jgi:hypothetical protein